MTLGNMRQHGIERVELTCAAVECGFSRSVAVTTWPDSYPVPDVGLRIACPKCGAPEVESRPDWSGYQARRRSG